MNFQNPILDTSSLQYWPWQAYLVATTPNPQVSPTPYRPVGWGTDTPDTLVVDEDGEIWCFDAIMRLEHSQSQRITQHPVQNGANITDHSFSLPAQLTLEIGMSDVMDSFIPGQWSATYTQKSVKAYEQLLAWKNSGKPLTIETRLDTYSNMVIAHLSAPDDIKTKYGLRCMATFQQIILATISISKVEPPVLQEKNEGSKQVSDVNLTNSSGVKTVVSAAKSFFGGNPLTGGFTP